jgi:Cu-processing system permease protein
MLAYDAVIGEHEQGTLLLLLTYPLTRPSLLLGKFLGHGLILAVATVVGFGVAGVVIGFGAEDIAVGELARALGMFILSAVLLGWVFVALAYLVSVLVSEKSRAAGLALLLWFLFVLVFDLAMLALLVGAGEHIGPQWLSYLLLLNPTECFRLLNLSGFPAAQAASGVSSVAAGGALHPASLLTSLTAWIAVPLALAVWRFRHRHA